MTEPRDKPLATRLGEALGGDYTLEGEIGRGGMGVVYRARDERLQRRVAIKVLPPELAFQKDIRERFTREAQTAARLSHPHIVPIHTVGEAGGLVYFVMGYVDGESLGQRIKRRGPLPVEEARRIMRETADALSAAHSLSVIHRDIKPDNVLLEGTRGRVMVTDFGIAKALSATSGATLTGAGVAIGTPSFMSPEQAAGERDIDGRSDIYSLGIVSYLMLTGELPFAAPTVAGILMKQITEVPPLVSTKRHDVSEDLSLAVSRCMEKDPENRWPTADALRRSLESRVVTGYQPTGLGWRAAPSAAPERSRRASAARPRTSGRDRNQLERHRGARGDELAPRTSSRRRRPKEWSEDTGEKLVRDTGEPKIVQKFRAQFASYAAVNGGLFLLNIATTQLDPPWFLFPAAGWGIGLLSSYAKLWQSGYSWRDVLSRPPAPDAVETKTLKGGKLPRQLPSPKADDFGRYTPSMLQIQRDRGAILRLAEQLPTSDKAMLPEIVTTVDGLYGRASELAQTLHALDGSVDLEDLETLDQRLGALRAEPSDDERDRRIGLLERQRSQMQELRTRRDQVAANLESCVLAMQNLRFDVMKLKTAGVDAKLSDLTQATQQARALSRDIDHAISAADEIREALR